VAGQWLGGDSLSDVLLAVVGLVGSVVGESEAVTLTVSLIGETLMWH
jgi:hypothetical protein